MSVNTLVNNELQRVAGSDSRHVDYNMQISTMPEASAQYANLIFQYVGTTDENYTNGYFYKCFVNEETTPTSYTWKVLKLNTLPITSYKELQEYWGLGGGGGDANIEPLNIGTNGIYQAPTGVDGYAPITVDVYEKYNILFFSGSTNYSPQTLNDDASDEKYSELWITGYYLYNDNGYKNALWSGRYPSSILFPLIAGSFIYGGGPHNHMWITPTNGNHFHTLLAEYDFPYMYIGIKNANRTEDVLWQSTESSTPSTINLTESIFDYDEVCFFFIKPDGAAVTSWYCTDEIAVNDIIQGYIDTNVSKYTIASNTSLTTVSEDGFRLYGVYGVKDTSMDKATLFANPGSTNPSTMYLSDDYTKYDELTLIGHYITDGTICTSVYPVKMFGMRDDINAADRMCVGTKQNAAWMTIISPLSFVLDPPSGGDYTIILDKIIGIKRPVIGDIPEIQTNVRQINPFPSGETTITPYHSNGVTVNSSGINSDGTAALNISEWSNGYEGMVIELNATADHIYAVEFDYQNINTNYMTGFPIGWLLENEAHTSYEDTSHWRDNLPYNDTLKHHIKGSIVATGNKIYMNFNLCGYSDYQTNTIEITNLKVYEITIPEE